MVPETKNQLKKQVEDLTNRWKRALADYQNLEKRYEREKEDFVQFANANLIKKLLTVFSHTERAAGSLKDEGLDLVLNEFQKVLKDEGVEEIECLGKSFDPCLMEALELVKGGEKEIVSEIVEKGYLLKEKLLRPAKVKVFQGRS